MPDFAISWIQAYNHSGLNWVQVVGSFLLIYSYLISKPKPIWYILLAHGLSGFFGIMIETAFSANSTCCSQNQLSWFLLVNEINWIINESSTVLYSILKLQVVIKSKGIKKILKFIMAILFCLFAGFRFFIGYLRWRDNVTQNADIARAHSYAFIIWGLADFIVFILLIYNTWKYFSNPDMNKSVAHIMSSLFASSLPRFFVIIINTFILVIIGQLPSSSINTSNGALNDFVWLVKGTYTVSIVNVVDLTG